MQGGLNEKVTNKIREIRNRLGLSQKALAQKADICQSMLCAIETGRLKPGQSAMRRIAKALRISIHDVFMESDMGNKRDCTESLAAPVQSADESTEVNPHEI